MTGPLEPTTSGTGGQRARLAAVLAIVVLIGFVFVGLTGREATPPVPAETPSPGAVALATEIVPEPSPRPSPRVRLSQPAQIEQIRSGPPDGRPHQFLGAVLTMGGQGYIADLEQIGPGHYSTAYRIRLPLPAFEATVELAEILATTSHDTWRSLGRWQLELDPLLGHLPTAASSFSASHVPELDAVDGPPLARSGFTVAVTTESRAGFAVMSIEVRAGPPERLFDDETYVALVSFDGHVERAPLTEVARGRLRGTLPVPAARGLVSFEVMRSFSPFPLFGHDTVTVWQMEPDQFRAATALPHLHGFHFVVAPPSELSHHHPRLVRSGYTLTAWAAPGGDDGGRVIIDIVSRDATR